MKKSKNSMCSKELLQAGKKWLFEGGVGEEPAEEARLELRCASGEIQTCKSADLGP